MEQTVWIIIRNEREQLHTVGHYNPRGEFVSLRDFADEDTATRYIHWLNGGDSLQAFFEADDRRGR
jgi:hypothetical protein